METGVEDEDDAPIPDGEDLYGPLAGNAVAERRAVERGRESRERGLERSATTARPAAASPLLPATMAVAVSADLVPVQQWSGQRLELAAE